MLLRIKNCCAPRSNAQVDQWNITLCHKERFWAERLVSRFWWSLEALPPCCHCTSNAEVMFSQQMIFGSAKVAASAGRCCKSKVPLSRGWRLKANIVAKAGWTVSHGSIWTLFSVHLLPRPVGFRGAAKPAESLSDGDKKRGSFASAVREAKPISVWQGTHPPCDRLSGGVEIQDLYD